MEALIIVVGALGLFVATLAIGTILRGFVINKFWIWFVLPVFDSAPALDIGHAIGISMVVSILTYQHVPQLKDQKYDSTGAIAFGLSYPLTALLMGWVVKQFI